MLSSTEHEILIDHRKYKYLRIKIVLALVPRDLLSLCRHKTKPDFLLTWLTRESCLQTLYRCLPFLERRLVSSCLRVLDMVRRNELSGTMMDKRTERWAIESFKTKFTGKQIRNYSRGFYFCETSRMRSFVKIKPSRNAEITLSFTDVSKSCHVR